MNEDFAGILPLQENWQLTTNGRQEWKEILGRLSFFHKHEGHRMYEVIQITREILSGTHEQKYGKEEKQLVGWICPACNMREHNAPTD